MTRFLNILRYIVAAFFVTYLALIFALDQTRVRVYLAHQLETQLEKVLDTHVDIEKVEVSLVNAVELHNVALYDRNDELMLQSKMIYGKVSLMPLLKGKVFLRNISVLDADIALYKKESDGKPNYQFLIDAFKSKDKKKRRIDLSINSLLLRRCNVSYDDRYVPQPAEGVFSPHHVRLHDFEANVSLKELTTEQLHLRLRHLQGTDRSGLCLKSLRLQLHMDRRGATIQDAVLQLPHSRVEIPQLTVHYDGSSRQNFINTLTVDNCQPTATLTTQDIAPLIPQLCNIDEVFSLTLDASCSNRRMILRDVCIANADKTLTMKLGGGMDYSNATFPRVKIDVDLLHLDATALCRLAQLSSEQKAHRVLTQMGGLDYAGKMDAVVPRKVLDNLDKLTFATQGVINSGQGSIAAEFDFKALKFNGKVRSSKFNLGHLLQNDRLPAALDFTLDVQSALEEHGGKGERLFVVRQGAADLLVSKMEMAGNSYSNIRLRGDVNDVNVALQATADDPALRMQSQFSAVMHQPLSTMRGAQTSEWLADIVGHINVDALSPALLHLTQRYKQGTVRFQADAYAEALDLKHLNAHLSVRDFTLQGDGDYVVPYTIRNTSLAARSIDGEQHLTLRSDFADIDYVGPLEPKRAQQIVSRLVTSIRNGEYRDDSQLNRVNDQPCAHLSLDFKDATILQRLLGVNVSQRGAVHAQGSVSYDGRDLTFSCIAPELSFGKFGVNGLSLFVRNNDGSFNLLAKGAKRMKGGEVHAEVTAVNADGNICSTIEWDEINHHKFYGAISAVTSVDSVDVEDSEDNRVGSLLRTVFAPSQICIGDSIWHFSPSTIDYCNKQFAIRDFGIYNANQRLLINGSYDRSTNDTIVVSLDNIDLDYALAFANLGVVEFGGHASGNIYVRQLADGSPWAKAFVHVPDFTFNHTPFGMADVTLGWSHEKRDITIQGDITQPGIGYTKVRGYVDPVNRDLDLRTESKNTPLGFLNKYTEGIFSDVSGQATGNCRIYGGFRTIEFSGHENGNCQATIPITGVTYRVENADVDVVPDAFIINNATVRDMFSGYGTGHGSLTHKHIKDLCYDFQLEGRNLRMYDKPREIDMPFFATANGTGNVHIYGEPHKMNADIRIATMPGSEMTYILDSPDADVSQLINFHTPDLKQLYSDTQTSASELKLPASDTPGTQTVHAPSAADASVPATDINLYFEVDVDDQSCLHMITDDKSGDLITVYGSGPIQASYHNKSGFQMFGTYNIDRGTYGLNIPSLAQRKKFDILSGGQVRFSGDPTEAEVNVKAQYVVNSASLADLNIGTGFANNTTRVNCVVDIYGEVANMQFNLDFELPNCSDDEQRMVQNLIASEEDRTMQVLYLLGVGRFYAYNYTANDLGQSQSVLMMNSLLSSTLSSQLNSIISDAIGSNKWTFGTNISTGQLGWNDMEVEGLVSSRLLNNRLILNGNFGYSDRVAATTNFVGDFDMQYLITPKGNVSVRAYSETNDRYFTKSTLTTQGIGLQLKKDFTRFLYLFRKKKQQNK